MDYQKKNKQRIQEEQRNKKHKENLKRQVQQEKFSSRKIEESFVRNLT